jgi:hypothetical protein
MGATDFRGRDEPVIGVPGRILTSAMAMSGV